MRQDPFTNVKTPVSSLKISKYIIISADPFRLLVAYIKVKGLRLWDLFQQFDKDGSMSVSRAEFREGIQVELYPRKHSVTLSS